MMLQELMDDLKENNPNAFYEMCNERHFEGALHFWKQGVKSGFPLCCITFFVSTWNETFRNQFLTNQNEWGWGDGKGRIFCPGCIAEKLDGP